MGDWIEVNEGGDAWDQKEPIQGVYKAAKQNVGPNNSNMYMVDVKGNLTGIWGSAVIDSKFEQIPVGSEVRVEFKGMAEGKRGQYKDYKVQYKPTEISKVADQFDGAEVI